MVSMLRFVHHSFIHSFIFYTYTHSIFLIYALKKNTLIFLYERLLFILYYVSHKAK
jgi:hypothetical protein